jgi:hypothetical protein
MQNGEDWTYPAEGFKGSGTVNGLTVRCLSPATLLQERFGLELPPELKREADLS